MGAASLIQRRVIEPGIGPSSSEGQLAETLAWHVAELGEGRLGGRVDPTPYDGRYREVMEGINRTSERLDRSMTDLREALIRVGGGDLDVSLAADGDGAVAETQSALSEAVSNLAGVVDQLARILGTASRACERLKGRGEGVSAGLSVQVEVVDQLGGTVGQVEGIVRHTAECATVSRALTAQVHGAAGRGGALCDDIAGGVSRVRADHEDALRFAQLVRGMAAQAELLAFNAAIEAARSGARGRGIAVVADGARALYEHLAELAGHADAALPGAQEHLALLQDRVAELRRWAQGVESTAEKAVHISAEVAAASGELLTSVDQLRHASDRLTPTLREVAVGASLSVDVGRELSQHLWQLREGLARLHTRRPLGFEEIAAPPPPPEVSEVEREADAIFAEVMSGVDDLFPMGEDRPAAEL